VLRDEAPPIQSARPDLPDDLARLITRCLEKDPERRLQSAKDLRNELKAIQMRIASAPWSAGAVAPALAPRPSPWPPSCRLRGRVGAAHRRRFGRGSVLLAAARHREKSPSSPRRARRWRCFPWRISPGIPNTSWTA